MGKKTVTFRVDEELYWAYKKALAEMHAYSTDDLVRHMNAVVERAKQTCTQAETDLRQEEQA